MGSPKLVDFCAGNPSSTRAEFKEEGDPDWRTRGANNATLEKALDDAESNVTLQARPGMACAKSVVFGVWGVEVFGVCTYLFANGNLEESVKSYWDILDIRFPPRSYAPCWSWNTCYVLPFSPPGR